MQTNFQAEKTEFVDLLEEHQRYLFRVIFCIVHSLPDAEDVLQQTIVSMWESFGEFQPGTSFLAWSRSIARLKALAFLRSKGRDRLCFSEELIAQLASQPAASIESEEAALQALAQCRKKLSDADQQLLTLCYGGAPTIFEAANVIGRPVNSVYASLTRIRRVLFGCIQRTLAAEGVE